MELDIGVMLLLFAVAGAAGLVDALAGGGGLIVVPALLAAGLPPATALATNKLQAVGGSLAATTFFARSGLLDARRFIPAVLCAFIGSTLGAMTTLMMSPARLQLVIPIVLICVALYVAIDSKRTKQPRGARMTPFVYGVGAGLVIGFYDGFLGPGTGTMFCMSMVALLGFDIVKATAHAKMLNLATNAAALGYFFIFGHIAWVIGLVMLAGQLIGGWVGARMALKRGQRLIRMAVIVICVIMSAKLVAQRFF